MAAGLDSLGAVELRNTLQDALGLTLPVSAGACVHSFVRGLPCSAPAYGHPATTSLRSTGGRSMPLCHWYPQAPWLPSTSLKALLRSPAPPPQSTIMIDAPTAEAMAATISAQLLQSMGTAAAPAAAAAAALAAAPSLEPAALPAARVAGGASAGLPCMLAIARFISRAAAGDSAPESSPLGPPLGAAVGSDPVCVVPLDRWDVDQAPTSVLAARCEGGSRPPCSRAVCAH